MRFTQTLGIASLLSGLISIGALAKAGAVSADQVSATSADTRAATERIQARLKAYEDRITQLKNERDQQESNTERKKALQDKIAAMEERTENIRKKLADMRNDNAKTWREYESEISDEFKELEKAEHRRAD